ncbi:MAG: GrpB family protein [Chitinophagaceae bacterium]
MIELIEPIDNEWKEAFQQIRLNLLNTLSEFTIEIEHVGSTAINGLIAKPIIDIDIILYNKLAIQSITKSLKNVGYIFKGDQGIEGRFAFKQPNEKVPFSSTNYTWHSHHLYVCFADSLAVKNHLLFRQALQENDFLVKKYADIKKALANEKGMNRELYTKRKTDFILHILSEYGLSDAEIESIRIANS